MPDNVSPAMQEACDPSYVLRKFGKRSATRAEEMTWRIKRGKHLTPEAPIVWEVRGLGDVSESGSRVLCRPGGCVGFPKR